jgi:hypothetical protein
MVGSFTDTLFIWSGFIVFQSNPFAPYFTSPWMISIWISFAVLMFATLSSLFKHYFILGILSFLGFALAYGFGTKMGAALFPHGYGTCVLIGITWAIVLPICVYIYQRQVN